MKVIRLLVYEGPEEELETHLSQSFIHPGRAFKDQTISIREIFRGEQKDSEVVHLDSDIMSDKQDGPYTNEEDVPF